MHVSCSMLRVRKTQRWTGISVERERQKEKDRKRKAYEVVVSERGRLT